MAGNIDKSVDVTVDATVDSKPVDDAPKGPPVPAWWKNGVEVMSGAGYVGKLYQGDDGNWTAQFQNGKGDPDPSPTDYTQINQALGITPQQIRRICYDAERAVLVAAGRAGGTFDWSSLPETKTASAAPVHPKPLGTDQLSDMRRDVVAAIQAALRPYLA